MEHREFQDLLALHAVDALDASDGRRVEEHLASCAECRAELTELQETAGLLAHASPAAEPSAAVRMRIMDEVRKEKAAGTAAFSRVVPFQARPAPAVWPNALRIAAAIAFVALAVGLIGVFLSVRKMLNSRDYEIQVQRQELEREREARRRAQEALAVLTSGETTTMALAGTQSTQNARAMFAFDKNSGRAVLMTEGLPVAPPGMAYEVWFIPKGRAPMPGKTFTVDEKGHAMMMDQMPPEAMQDAVIAITLEPEKGSASPTGAIYLSSAAS
jgi:anti-sigma-K factor RskA